MPAVEHLGLVGRGAAAVPDYGGTATVTEAGGGHFIDVDVDSTRAAEARCGGAGVPVDGRADAEAQQASRVWLRACFAAACASIAGPSPFIAVWLTARGVDEAGVGAACASLPLGMAVMHVLTKSRSRRTWYGQAGGCVIAGIAASVLAWCSWLGSEHWATPNHLLLAVCTLLVAVGSAVGLDIAHADSFEVGGPKVAPHACGPSAPPRKDASWCCGDVGAACAVAPLVGGLCYAVSKGVEIPFSILAFVYFILAVGAFRWGPARQREAWEDVDDGAPTAATVLVPALAESSRRSRSRTPPRACGKNGGVVAADAALDVPGGGAPRKGGAGGDDAGGGGPERLYRCPLTSRIIALGVFVEVFAVSTLTPTLPVHLQEVHNATDAALGALVSVSTAAGLGAGHACARCTVDSAGGTASILAIVTGVVMSVLLLSVMSNAVAASTPQHIVVVAGGLVGTTASAALVLVGGGAILRKTAASLREARVFFTSAVCWGLAAGALFGGAMSGALGLSHALGAAAALLGTFIVVAVPSLLCLNPSGSDDSDDAEDDDDNDDLLAPTAESATPPLAAGPIGPLGPALTPALTNTSITSHSSAVSSVLKDSSRLRGSGARVHRLRVGTADATVDAAALADIASPRTRERIVKFIDEAVPPGAGASSSSGDVALFVRDTPPAPAAPRRARAMGIASTPPVRAAPTPSPTLQFKQRSLTPDARASLSDDDIVPRGPTGKVRNVLRRKAGAK